MSLGLQPLPLRQEPSKVRQLTEEGTKAWFPNDLAKRESGSYSLAQDAQC